MNHSCPPVAKTVPNNAEAPTISAAIISPPSISTSNTKSSARPDSAKVVAILRDPKKLANAIKSLEFALKSGYDDSAEQDKMRVRLEASFGKIDWSK